MKRIRKLALLAALASGGLAAKAQGLEGIIVENYYTISPADAAYLNGLGLTYPINPGAKVYRIYVDMAPNYKLNTVNGSPLPQGGGPSPNPLDFTTTTTFWNEDGFGSEVPPQTSRFDDGAAFDSYITVGVTGRSGGTAGCGTAVQNQGVLKFQDTNGNLTNCAVYSGFPNAGAADGNMPTTTAIPALTYNLGGLIDFSALTADGNQLTVIGDAWATLPNGPGFDPTGTNRVLIAQLTTDGQLSFHINVQLQAPGGALETYVWNQADAGEVVSPLLTYPNVDCLGVPGGTTVEGSACSDGNACTINDVYNALCVCTGTTPSGSYDMATASSNANSVPNTAFADISAGNNNGTTTLITNTSVSSGYTGVTGGNNAGAAAFTGALNTATSTYFEVTATPNAGTVFTLTGLSFGTRSTSTGPQAYAIRTSADGFAADVATGTIPNTSVWVPRSNLSLSVPSLSGQPLTIRIYGHSGTGSPGAGTANWRIDDLSIFGCNTTACTAPMISSTTSNSPICSTDALSLSVVATGTAPLSYSWSGTGTITNGDQANASVTGAASGTYPVTVSNGCGSVNGTVNVTVNTATNWYADTDGDGFGAGAPTLACDQPIGSVANNTDDCPTVPGVIGSTCDDGNALTTNDVLNASCVCTGMSLTAITGCSSSQSPYVKPLGTGKTTTSILTVGDLIGGYDMVGIPDGMGAFDNNDGTFTLLMNHELGATAGITRAHGFAGSFVSKWVINKSNLCVQSGADLITNLQTWNGSTYVPATAAMGRLCSGDLPAISAFYNAGTGKGTQERIHMNGEEVGAEGRAFAHIATGPNAGTSYELPYLGKFSWENSVACPVAQDKTIVIGLDDTTPGQLYVYVGEKRSTGTEIEKAGLDDGNLYGVKVSGIALESAGTYPSTSTAFSLHNFGNVASTTGAALQTASVANGVTEFLRPEDGHFDPSNPNVFYFVTTASFSGPSRLYKLTFTDILQPQLGGTIVAVLDGTEGQKMMDNMTVDQRGGAYIQEDVGNNVHIGKIWKYDIATDVLTQVAYHDSSRFIIGQPNYLTQDEESSGIIDMQDILGKGKYLFNVQAHYGIPGELVEGGQLLEFSSNDTLQPCVAPTIAAISGAQTLCSADTLELDAVASGTGPVNYSWSGTGSFLFGSNQASALVTGAASGTYTVTATNACGTATGTVNVTVNPTTNDTTTISACDTYTWAVNGQTYTTSGTYTNVAGCDTDVLVLTITPSTSNTTTISACDSYTWAVDGQTYTTSGTYTSVTGCATEILVLTITPSTSNTTTISACDSYTWAVDGQTYTASGTYTSVTGCATEILVLTITPSTSNTTTISACDSYTWAVNGQTYTTSGTYTSVTGCATEILVLTITGTSSSNTTSISACDTYTWAVNGQTYTTSGTYTSVMGCNTEILVLTITPSTSNTTTISACDSYTWAVDGQTYTTSGTYTSVTGCATEILVLTITPSTSNTTTITACSTYTWSVNGQTYMASGTYTSVNGCATEILVLTINVPGTACDDGDANTINDVLNASCVCQGTPVGGCNANEVTLTMTTDANGGQTSYDIVLTGTNTVVCSGSGFASNSTIASSCCLPNGCYDLRVFDSAGDGITAPGGYILRDANNQRIIDNTGNGATFTSTSQSPLGFCVPLGSDALQAASCDVLTATPSTVLRAQLNAAVTSAYIAGSSSNANHGYQFWVTNPNGGFSRRILLTHAVPGAGWPVGTPNNQKASFFQLSAMSSAPTIPQGVLLNVRVRTRLNGVYNDFGPACLLLVPVPACQTTQLTTTATPVVSCGATGLSLTSTIYANAVPGATSYQFEFTKPGYLRRITAPTRSQALSFVTSPLQVNNCYNVRVRVSVDNGATFCPFGPTCTITIGTATCSGSAMAPLADDHNHADLAIATTLSIWPNPNDGASLNVSLTPFDEAVSAVRMEVTDVFGKLVATRTIPVQDGLLNSRISFEQDLAPGLYLVNLQAGDQRFTERLIIQ